MGRLEVSSCQSKKIIFQRSWQKCDVPQTWSPRCHDDRSRDVRLLLSCSRGRPQRLLRLCRQVVMEIFWQRSTKFASLDSLLGFALAFVLWFVLVSYHSLLLSSSQWSWSSLFSGLSNKYTSALLTSPTQYLVLVSIQSWNVSSANIILSCHGIEDPNIYSMYFTNNSRFYRFLCICIFCSLCGRDSYTKDARTSRRLCPAHGLLFVSLQS